MDNPTYLAMLRRRLVDTDPAAERFTDDELWDVTADVNLEYAVSGIFQFGPYTVTTVGSGLGFSPAATDQDGLLVLKRTAWLVLTDLYRDAVNRGELGGSWKSGLEEESTTANQRAWATILDDLAQEVQTLLILRAQNVSGTRVQ